MIAPSRNLSSQFLFTGLLLASLAPLVRAEDEIRFLDRDSKGVVTVMANIEQESIDGLRFRLGARTETVDVPVFDLVDVLYGVPGSLRLVLSRARSEEQRSNALDLTSQDRLAALDRAIKEFEHLLIQGEQLAPAAARRQWRFHIARLKAQAAAEDPKRAKAAVEALTSFLQQGDSWQTDAAANLLARVLTLEGNPERAAEAFRKWTNGKGTSPEVKREFARQAILWDVLARNFKQATQTLAALKPGTPAATGEAVQLQALEHFLTAAEGKPEKALGDLDVLETSAKEDSDRGHIWLIRGQCEVLAGRDDRAFWAFLRVDQMCRENQFARARAVEQLVRLFEGRSDWPKAAFYRCKLWRDFSG
ncbi:hypothetical protein BH10PLA2_BH10PLA2_14500 [soil metagenome]